jgi:hypothetical protein
MQGMGSQLRECGYMWIVAMRPKVKMVERISIQTPGEVFVAREKIHPERSVMR